MGVMAAADTSASSSLSFPSPPGVGSNHAILKFLVSSFREKKEDGYSEGGSTGLQDTANFLRVQELFFASMSVCSGGEGDDVVSLTGPDPKSVENAKVSCFIK